MKKWLYAILIIFIVAGVLAYMGYQKVFNPAVEKDATLLIPSQSTYNDVIDQLTKSEILSDINSFSQVSGWMNYGKDKTVPSGKYDIKKGWSHKQLISKLRAGNQDAVKVTINNVREIENLSAKFSSYLEVDSSTLLRTIISDSILKKYDADLGNIMTLFIPNTYEFWWDSSPEEIVERMAKEYDRFWSKNERKEKAAALELSQREVYILASIVEKETQLNSEKPRIAGVYLNRLQRGILLQADPTVVFATRLFDLRRVLNKHLQVDSPYNTYKYAGLPPGPIYMPGIKSIDAVLNAESHKYIYFCAKPDNSGAHAFATNLIGHNKNAQRYWNWLRKNRIR